MTVVRKTAVTLADGRALLYFGATPAHPADYPDRRELPAVQLESQARFDKLLGEWVVIAGHRQDRTFLPAADECPLCPTSAGSRTEIPAPEYEVVVFENRFPTLSQPGGGRCEVVCFSPDHAASFADLNPGQVSTVIAAWTDRSAELAQLPAVEQVYCFENRGQDIGVTLSHPHGQIYAYPYITPRTDRMLQSCASYRRETGRNLFDDMLAAEHADAARIVLAGTHWTAFVPYAAHWPYEVHLYPRERVPDLTALQSGARAEFCELYLDLLRRFDRLFDSPAPYISAWHQAPVRHGLERLRPAPGAVHGQARARQAEVPGRIGVGDGRVRQRHHTRSCREPPARTRLTQRGAVSAIGGRPATATRG